MNYDEELARGILIVIHAQEQIGKTYPRPFVGRTGGGNRADRLNPNWHRTYWRRRLMERFGIKVTRRWLRRQ